MNARTRAEKFGLNEAMTDLIATQIEEAEQEAFKNGRLDAQYDKDTMPEQIEAYKRKAYAEGFKAGYEKGLRK